LVLLLATGVGLRPRSLRWNALRSLLLLSTWLLLYASLPVLSLSVTAVAVYTNPIMIALLSAVLLGEAVSPRQWGWVMLGFLGVLSILRQGTDAFSWFTLLPLGAAALYAMTMVLTRGKCRDEPPLTLSLGIHASFLIAGLIATAVLALIGLETATRESYPFVLGDWAVMGLNEWGLMALIGTLLAIYFIGVARAHQIAPPPVIATFDYTYLISAALWGYVLFADAPDLPTIGGMVLITAAGLLAAPRRTADATD
tara:strand:+ start:3795 stop:4559 length:765 start_codon:yes stop_codon:yes gene_type:complete